MLRRLILNLTLTTVYLLIPFHTSNAAPGAFSITGPANPINSTTPTVTWGASSGAVNYDLKVDDTSGCGSPVQTYNTYVGTSKVLSALTNGTTYYVCILSRDNVPTTTNATNNNYSFVVDTTPPGAFSINALTTPTNDNTVTISWGASAGASTYDLRVDNTSGCGSPEYTAYGLGTTSNTTTAIADGTWYICVVAKDAATNSTTASNTNYTIVVDTVVPGAFSITGPTTPINSATPTVTWGSSSGAATYDLKVDDTSGCGSPLQTYNGLAGTSQALTSLSDGTYYTCVTSKDSATNSTVSTNNNRSFVIDTVAPGAPTFVIDEGNTTNTTAPTITFTESSGMTTTTEYQIYIDNNSNCSSPETTATGLAADGLMN